MSLHLIWYWLLIYSKLLLLQIGMGLELLISLILLTWRIGGCVLSTVFSASKEMIMWFFFFEFVYIVDYVSEFLYIKPTLHSRMKPTWSWWMMCSWIWFARILLSIMTSIFISEIGLKFSFLVESLCGLGIKVIVASSGKAKTQTSVKNS